MQSTEGTLVISIQETASSLQTTMSQLESGSASTDIRCFTFCWVLHIFSQSLQHYGRVHSLVNTDLSILNNDDARMQSQGQHQCQNICIMKICLLHWCTVLAAHNLNMFRQNGAMPCLGQGKHATMACCHSIVSCT